MTGTLFGQASVRQFKDLRQANLARLVWIDSMNNFEPSDPLTSHFRAWNVSLHYTALPSHASSVIISKPPEHVARYGLERLMTCCSHRRSS